MEWERSPARKWCVATVLENVVRLEAVRMIGFVEELLYGALWIGDLNVVAFKRTCQQCAYSWPELWIVMMWIALQHDRSQSTPVHLNSLKVSSVKPFASRIKQPKLQ